MCQYSNENGMPENQTAYGTADLSGIISAQGDSEAKEI